MSNAIKAIFFDHDDTLVETIGPKWAQHKYIARTFYDKELGNEEILRHWGKPLTVLIKELYKTDNIDMAMSYNIATRSKFSKLLFDDTLETLKITREAGMLLGLVTATTRSSLDNDFKTMHIAIESFDYIQTEDDTIVHKPDPAVFAPAVKWLAGRNILPSEVIYVGDSLNDMKAASGAGFQFVGVGTGLVTVDTFEQQGVRGIRKLSDLLELLNLSRANR